MRPLFFAVLATVAAGMIAVITATPPRPVPGYALGAELVYRTQVGLAVFVALYAAAALSRLAYHGRTLTEIGTTGIKLLPGLRLGRRVRDQAVRPRTDRRRPDRS